MPGEKAKGLLMSDLNDEQLADYKQMEQFNVTAKSGRLYRVFPMEQSNVNELNEKGKVICNWCLAQDTAEPVADLQYAIKKLIEWDEDRFRRVAIPRQWPSADITEHVVPVSMYTARPAYALFETDLERIARDAQSMAESIGITLDEAMDRLVQAVGTQSEAYERLALVTGNAAQAIDAANVTWSTLDSVGQLEQIYLVNEETGELIARIDNDEE